MNGLLGILGALGFIGAVFTAFMGALMFQSQRAKAAFDESAALITQSKMLSDRMLEDYERMRIENDRLHGIVDQLTSQNITLGQQVKQLQVQLDRMDREEGTG
jgi:hypothetical protein